MAQTQKVQLHSIWDIQKCMYEKKIQIRRGIKILIFIFSDRRLAQSVKLLLAFAIFITHALQCYVAVDITWNDYIKQHIKNKEHNKFYEYAWRTVLVLITCEYLLKTFLKINFFPHCRPWLKVHCLSVSKSCSQASQGLPSL